MKAHLQQLLARLLENTAVKRQHPFWKGAFIGLLSLSFIVFALAGWHYRTGLISPWLAAIILALLAVVMFKVLQWLGALLHMTVRIIPTFVISIFIAAWLLFDFSKGVLRFGLPSDIQAESILIVMVSFTLLFGSGYALIQKTKYKWIHTLSALISISALVVVFVFLFREGTDPYPIDFKQTPGTLLSSQDISDPSQPGNYKVIYFTYGSGTDKRREEYRESIKYKSDTVDASKLLPEWKDKKAKWRERYWGFGVKNFPLNARVWMPESDSIMPIILIVHGNHGMEEHSDPGYQYLGELLASRGFITASIDENFINATWSGDFLGREMPTRGWLLLKHLEQWKKWNDDPEHELYQKVDLNRVILAGHSRGGEAVAIAAAYNHLSHFPDDATDQFDFNFGIQGIVAVAPTDKRYFRRLDLTNVNYLSLQGSYDADESSFFGVRQLERISFTDSAFRFKAGLFIHHANHGQFNTVWGRHDSGMPGKYLLNTKPMISGEEQRQIAKVYISAFAEILLHDKQKYLGLFKNVSSANDWLPDAIMLNRYKDSKVDVIADFEEDVDLITTSTPGASITGSDLVVWREEPLKYRDKDLQNNNAVVIGWNKKDSTLTKPYFQVEFKRQVQIDSNSSVVFNLSPGNPSDLKLKGKQADSVFLNLNFTIRLTDSEGNMHDVQLTNIKKLTPPLKVQFSKIKSLSEENWGDVWEPTLESFFIPISKFKMGASQQIRAISFQFDQSEKGIIILDEIGFTQP